MYSFSVKPICNQAHVKLVKEFNYQNQMQKPHRNRCQKKEAKNKKKPSRFKAAIFTCFDKSNQMKIELSDNEASSEVTP